MIKIPKQITQGDRITWRFGIPTPPATSVVSIFIRGQSSLNLTGAFNSYFWEFEITPSQSEDLLPGRYKAQLVAYSVDGKKTLGVFDLEVLPSFENLTELDTRTSEEKELEELEFAIAKLSSGVAEYYIGTRRVRYSELPQLYERQEYLRNRIAMIKNRGSIGGRNVGIRFQ